MRPEVRDDLRAALPGWAAGRVLTALGWLGAVVLVRWRASGVWTVQMHQGLFAWDGAFYRAIARDGYDAVGSAGARFHPLLPWLGRGDIGILIVGNVAALLAAAAVHRLVRVVIGDADLARRSATLVGIAPPAFVLVWAYAEGLLLLLSALLLLALHHRSWWWVAALATLATLARPTGTLLVVPVAVALLAAPRPPIWPPAREWAARIAAIGAPGFVMVAWLWWVGVAFGDAWRPVQVQRELRGGMRFPPFRLVEGLGEIVRDPLGDGLHLPFAVAIVWLTWVAWRRLPRTWGWYALVSTLVILSAANLNSTERYALGNVALVVAAACVANGRWWRPAVALSALGLVGMSALAWYGRYVP